jgi:hypothetical protein
VGVNVKKTLKKLLKTEWDFMLSTGPLKVMSAYFDAVAINGRQVGSKANSYVDFLENMWYEEYAWVEVKRTIYV